MQLVADYQCPVGEGPLWHPKEKKLMWLDIPTGQIFSYDPDTGNHEQVFQGDVLGGFTIQGDGSLLLFMAKGAIARLDQGELQYLYESLPDEVDSRFNDVIADPVGRVFCGTMPTKERLGRLYRLDLDGTIHVVQEDIGCANGMGFSPDNQSFYFTDSKALKIYRFDYDIATGEIRNRQVFVQVPEGEGVPDGMTVDADGFIWSARWDGSALYRYTPAGNVDHGIAFPAKKVSSVTFGGDTLRDIYVTTAGGERKETEGHGAGALFRLASSYQGRPEFESKITVR